MGAGSNVVNEALQKDMRGISPEGEYGWQDAILRGIGGAQYESPGILGTATNWVKDQFGNLVDRVTGQPATDGTRTTGTGQGVNIAVPMGIGAAAGLYQKKYLEDQPPFPMDETSINFQTAKEAMADPNLRFKPQEQYVLPSALAAEGGRIGLQGGKFLSHKDWLTSKGYKDMMKGMSGDEIIKLYDSVKGTWSKAKGGRIGYAHGTDKGPLYVDPETRDIPLTELESDLRWTGKEQRTDMYYDMIKMLGGMSDKEKKEFLHYGAMPYGSGWGKKVQALEYTDDPVSEEFYETGEHFNRGGRVAAQEGGLMNLGGMEKDYREDGGFVPLGGEEKADDVPARLSKNEFVFTADAVRAAGGGDVDAGAEVMENVMENLEAGGKVSEESQGLEGAQEMFANAQQLQKRII